MDIDNDHRSTAAACDAAEVHEIRRASAGELAASLGSLRDRLSRLWRAYREALPPTMELRYLEELNPPRWELGHIGWFEEYWIARNPQRLLGHRADPSVPRAASAVRRADELYNSTRVAHATRWHLDLPDAERTWHDVTGIRARTLALLPGLGSDDDALYFPRLAAMHEAMHAEAWVYMAQTLAIDLSRTGQALSPARQPLLQQLELPAQAVAMGSTGGGFAFDNEWVAQQTPVEAFSIDAAPVTWGRYLPFIEAGGYDDRRLWTDAGWAWRQRHGGRPRHVALEDSGWCRARFGHWVPIDPDEPALHLTLHEAQAWCGWAGRRLPTEAEWTCAAQTLGEAFAWGEVWEWTASSFAPFPGFEPHPYRDYSQPWFDGRPVLKGASFATWPGLKDARYRNYFTAQRNDILVGFRSCAA